MAAKRTKAQKRRGDALRIRRIIERAQSQIVGVFEGGTDVWWDIKKKGRMRRWCLNAKARSIWTALERAYRAADKLTRGGK